MALKLGKCRLCLKLGDFYSIYAEDGGVRLADMAMACAAVKIFEGDGLPDKVCSDCLGKLSSAYIFKQQCERADQDLRRNYVPPPGFSNTPPPPNRQSSDSGYSHRTDLSTQPKYAPQPEEPAIASSSKRKRKRRSDERNTSLLQESFSMNVASPVVSDNSRPKTPDKRPRYEVDSDYEYSGPNTADSDDDSESSDVKCPKCDKVFASKRSLAIHSRQHKNETPIKTSPSLRNNVVVEIPQEEDSGLGCNMCGKTFKLQIMLKRHAQVCQNQTVEKLESDEDESKPKCKYCNMKFKETANLEKHMRIVHAAVLHKEPQTPKPKGRQPRQIVPEPVPCIYCDQLLNDYESHNTHLAHCSKRKILNMYTCKLCTNREYPLRARYIRHVKIVHYGIKDGTTPKGNNSGMTGESEVAESFECRICSRKLPTQNQLVAHLAAHMSNLDNEEENRASPFDDSSQYSSDSSTIKNCPHCDKAFKYKKSLESHILVQHSKVKKAEVKTETADQSFVDDTYESEEESGQDGETDNTCNICDKQFSYKKVLDYHKRTKHTMTAGMKRSNVNLQKCEVTCLICDQTMKVREIKVHNQIHIDAHMKPRNLYVCSECSKTFNSQQTLGNHIKLVHRLNQQDTTEGGSYEITNVANFCEVVVTKSEPMDEVQSHNDGASVSSKLGLLPVVDLRGFSCPLCSKKMGNLLSLKRHINWHNNRGNNIMDKYDCKICDNVSFKFQCHYKIHMKTHYHDTNLDPKFLTCAICNRKSKHLRAAQAHDNWHKQTRFNTNQDYQCAICKRIFQYRKVYLNHMAVHYKKGESIEKTVDEIIESTNGEFKCPHCQKVLETANSLKCHLSWHRSKSSLYGSRYDCEICNIQFTNKRTHELHIRTHYEDDNGPFFCPTCGKGYNEESFFSRHVKSHNFDHQDHVKRRKKLQELREKKVKCPICPRYYPDLAHLIRHLKRTHPDSKMVKPDPDASYEKVHYSCKLCAKIFFNEKRLQFHEESHLRKPVHYRCKFCNKTCLSMKLFNIHVKCHLTKKYFDNPLQCAHCEEKFTWGYGLHHHLRDVHNIRESWISESGTQRVFGPLKELQCEVCLKILASKGNYERHIDYHNTLRCNYCFEYFSTKVFLEGHLAYSCEKRKLIGETEVYIKRIKCNVCYKAFHLQIKLACHLHTQHGIQISSKSIESKSKQELVCDYCFRVFENEDALASHKVFHRTFGYYGCIYCKKKFNTITSYNKHKNHHFSQLYEENPVKCEHCDETFVAFRDMIYHMRDVHNDDKDWVTMPKEVVEEECSICHKVFFNVDRHKRYHEENRCKKCREYFFSRTDFDQHLCHIDSDEEDTLTKEGEEKPAYSECTFCFKPITKKVSLIAHNNLHNTSHKISCRFCPAKFKTLDAFNIHAFSHRSRKYKRNPLSCPYCKDKFVKYGPFVKHLRGVHKVNNKMYYRGSVMPEKCVVCKGVFPNIHNHYRAHLQHYCTGCKKYIASQKLFTEHSCDKEDSDPTKVFVSEEDLNALINAYVPKEEFYEEKYYGYNNDPENVTAENSGETENGIVNGNDRKGVTVKETTVEPSPIIISEVLSLSRAERESNSQSLKEMVMNANETLNLKSNSKDAENKEKHTESKEVNGTAVAEEENDDDCIVIGDDDVAPSAVTISLDD